MPQTLPPLAYDPGDLVPHLSARALEIHHGKHHATYVARLNDAIVDTPLEGLTLEEIVRSTAGNATQVGVFNNAAQAWNHAFYWQSMKRNGGGAPTGALAQKLNQAFGSLEAFSRAFREAAGSQFGSGWAWLVLKGDRLEVCRTGNANTPLTTDARPLLTIDVWEHAYYLDYQNRRPDYVSAFLESLIDWDFVARNLERA